MHRAKGDRFVRASELPVCDNGYGHAIFIPNTGLFSLDSYIYIYIHALNITSRQDLVCLPIYTEKGKM